ncbi:hypothetical protein ACROYT_G012317 [Oculina patagonica]
MPRGWRESQRPDTSESQRGRPKLPLWKRRPSCDNESSPPVVSSPHNYFEQKQSVNETTDTTSFPGSFSPHPLSALGGHRERDPGKEVATDSGDSATSPTYLDRLNAKLNASSNTTETLVTYSPVNLQSGSFSPRPQSALAGQGERDPRNVVATESGDSATFPTYLDRLNAKLNASSNTTETLVTYSPVNRQPETIIGRRSHGGVSNYSSLVSNSSTNTSTKATSPSSTKPFSRLLAGMPSNMGMAGSVALPPSVPQWMQFLNKQDAGQKQQDMSSDTPDRGLKLKEKIEKHSNWEKERVDLLKRQESLEEELEQVKQAKEEAEQRVINLEIELRDKEEHVNELEKTLSTAQQALDEYRQKEPCDWVISRDEIHMTDDCLGVGGWGTVALGRFRGCKVAVKQIHELILSPYNRRLFEREMNIASRCRHPCLLQFIGATNDEGSPLFVTELMESSLRALLEQRPLSPRDISIISLDIAQALNYLHKSEPPIIHRDISSANVLLWRNGDQWRGKVSDYGTANFMQQTMTVTPGAMIYSAPEALTSNQTVKIDVFSFGVLLCEMCIRELPDPKQREEQVALVTNHVFRGLIRRCIQTDPEARPNMEEIIDDMDSS